MQRSLKLLASAGDKIVVFGMLTPYKIFTFVAAKLCPFEFLIFLFYLNTCIHAVNYAKTKSADFDWMCS